LVGKRNHIHLCTDPVASSHPLLDEILSKHQPKTKWQSAVTITVAIIIIIIIIIIMLVLALMFILVNVINLLFFHPDDVQLAYNSSRMNWGCYGDSYGYGPAFFFSIQSNL